MLSLQDCQAIADLTAEAIKIPNRPKIEIKSTKAGRARPITNYITIPLWVMNVSDHYATYYIVHEVCHFSTIMQQYLLTHGQFFKSFRLPHSSISQNT